MSSSPGRLDYNIGDLGLLPYFKIGIRYAPKLPDLTGIVFSENKLDAIEYGCEVEQIPPGIHASDAVREEISRLVPGDIQWLVGMTRQYENTITPGRDIEQNVYLPHAIRVYASDSRVFPIQRDIGVYWSVRYVSPDAKLMEGLRTNLPPGNYRTRCQYRMESSFITTNEPAHIGSKHTYSVINGGHFRYSFNVVQAPELQVSSPSVDCGTIMAGSRGYEKCPTVHVTSDGKAPDQKIYTLLMQLAPGPYNVYADAGDGKIVKIVNGGEYVRGNGSLHLYVSGEGAPVGKMNQTLTITARAK